MVAEQKGFNDDLAIPSLSTAPVSRTTGPERAGVSI
jgi:hypothetical protein